MEDHLNTRRWCNGNITDFHSVFKSSNLLRRTTLNWGKALLIDALGSYPWELGLIPECPNQFVWSIGLNRIKIWYDASEILELQTNLKI